MDTGEADLFREGDMVEHTVASRLGDAYLATFRSAKLYKRFFLVGTACACLSLFIIAQELLSPGGQYPGGGETASRKAALPGDAFSKRIASAHDLVDQLKKSGLWEIDEDREIPSVIFANYPHDFDKLDTELKKKAFLHTLLPVALVALAEVREEREGLETILAEFEETSNLVFDSMKTDWQERLDWQKIELVKHLARKYRAHNAAELLARIDTVPVSLVMAQAALESSWGASRFAEKGNNIFGLWTWGEQGIVPAERPEGQSHKVAVYDSILGSVRAYILTLNRLPAYRKLRQLRRESKDPLVLAEGLRHYSETGSHYVAELQRIIRYNRLERFDRFTLAGEPSSLPMGATRLTSLM